MSCLDEVTVHWNHVFLGALNRKYATADRSDRPNAKQQQQQHKQRH